jgi:hypothetical protein
LIPKTDSFQLTDDLQSTTEECSQVIPLLKSPIPDNVDCYSVYAAQHAIDRHVLVKKHPYDLAFALTDYKLQGRTLPKLVLSVCHRHRMPWMTLQSFYVLISRVTHMSGLRLLQHDQTGLDNVLTLMPDKFLYAWEQGYDTFGMWNKQLAATALRNIRSSRDIEKQASATEMRKNNFIDNQRSPAKERPNEHRSPTKKRPTLNKCRMCNATDHSARNCPTIARHHTTPTKKVDATSRPISPVASRAVRVPGDHPWPYSLP